MFQLRPRHVVIAGILLDFIGAVLLLVPEYPGLQQLIGVRDWIESIRESEQTLFEGGSLYHEHSSFETIDRIIRENTHIKRSPDRIVIQELPNLSKPELLAANITRGIERETPDLDIASVYSTIHLRKSARFVVYHWLSGSKHAKPNEPTDIESEISEFKSEVKESLDESELSEAQITDIMETINRVFDEEFPELQEGRYERIDDPGTVRRWIQEYPNRTYVKRGALVLVVGFALQLVGTALPT